MSKSASHSRFDLFPRDLQQPNRIVQFTIVCGIWWKELVDLISKYSFLWLFAIDVCPGGIIENTVLEDITLFVGDNFNAQNHQNLNSRLFNQAYLLFRCIVELIPCLNNFDFHSDLEMNPFFCVCGILTIAQFLLLHHWPSQRVKC